MAKRINSIQKGKSGEREIANLLTSKGFPSRRGVQYEGGSDSPDIIVDNLPQYHFEVKRVERGSLYPWLDQAIRDCKMKKVPVVLHRRSQNPWVAILRLEDFLNLVKPL